jgi:Helix-turn-helix domain
MRFVVNALVHHRTGGVAGRIASRNTRYDEISVTIPEAVQMTGIGRSSLYSLFRDGKIYPRKSGKRTLVLVEDLERYVKSLPTAA